jgi:hypothetical protein
MHTSSLIQNVYVYMSTAALSGDMGRKSNIINLIRETL